MKLSIVTAILNSPEIMRRQLLYFNKLDLPDDVEVVYADDGSAPPLEYPKFYLNFKFSLHKTNDFRPWSQTSARNFAARKATGEYLICTDIDHIISSEAIEVARTTLFDKVRFKRQLGVLDEQGNFTQDWKALRAWGCDRGHLRIAPHSNSYIIRRKLFLKVGGVFDGCSGLGKYPQREEIPLKRKLKRLEAAGEITICDDDTKPTIYLIPNGRYCGDRDYNPFGFFHSLSRTPNLGRESKRYKLNERLISNNTGKK